MMRVAVFAWTVSFAAASAQASSIDLAAARVVFTDYQTLCREEAGRLWGASLCGPLILVDPGTRDAVANTAGNRGGLRPDGDMFVARLPEDQLIANTSVEYDGVRWTMVLWPLPEPVEFRDTLLFHEAWHRVQPELGLPASSPVAAHLSEPEARVALRLEWRALAQAVAAETAALRRGALRDALLFRAWRRSVYPDGLAQEAELELNEGLAEYTGWVVSGRLRDRRALANTIRAYDRAKSLARRAGYVSGPAYGAMLDLESPGWRTGLKAGGDLGAMLAGALRYEPPDDLRRAVDRAGAKYDLAAVRSEEAALAAEQARVASEWKAKLVDGPTLVLPFRQMSIEFDPTNLFPLGSEGTLYPTLRIVDVWGVLTVDGGALVSSDFSNVRVAAPVSEDGSAQTGPGWRLQLSDGWLLTPGPRGSDWILVERAGN